MQARNLINTRYVSDTTDTLSWKFFRMFPTQRLDEFQILEISFVPDVSIQSSCDHCCVVEMKRVVRFLRNIVIFPLLSK